MYAGDGAARSVCGRIVRVFDPKLGAWVTKYDANWDKDPSLSQKVRQTSFNVPPLSWLPIVGPGAPRLSVAQWGFPAPGRAGRVINTRVETASRSPFWRGVAGRGNCVVPATGFYEWDHSGPTPRPHFLHRADGAVMAIAGLAAEREVDGERRLVVSLLTRTPDALVAPLHDRMPAILEEDEIAPWLAGGPVEALAEPREGVLQEHPVSPAVNDAKAEGPHLIAPLANRQARLEL